jgi:hypothetical protein
MLMKNVETIFFMTLITLWLSSCAKDSDDGCDCTYNHSLPEPAKILRKGSGFTPVKYHFSLDLASGEAEYERTEGLGSDACRGTLNLAGELAEWKAAAVLTACTRVLPDPASDGFVDAMVLYFPPSETPPEPLARQTYGDWITVEIQESFNDSVGGRQQFDCSGQFAMDSLIMAHAPCLGVLE